MRSITDDTYYEIDTEEFTYSPYAPVSKESIKREKKYWKSKSPEEYYNTMKTSILDSFKYYGVMYEPIDNGATCKKLRVFLNADKQQIQIDWKFDGNSYEVYV